MRVSFKDISLAWIVALPSLPIHADTMTNMFCLPNNSGCYQHDNSGLYGSQRVYSSGMSSKLAKDSFGNLWFSSEFNGSVNCIPSEYSGMNEANCGFTANVSDGYKSYASNGYVIDSLYTSNLSHWVDHSAAEFRGETQASVWFAQGVAGGNPIDFEGYLPGRYEYESLGLNGGSDQLKTAAALIFDLPKYPESDYFERRRHDYSDLYGSESAQNLENKRPKYVSVTVDTDGTPVIDVYQVDNTLSAAVTVLPDSIVWSGQQAPEGLNGQLSSSDLRLTRRVWFLQSTLTGGLRPRLGFFVPESPALFDINDNIESCDPITTGEDCVVKRELSCKQGEQCFHYYDLPVSIGSASDIAFDSKGDIWVTNWNKHKVAHVKFSRVSNEPELEPIYASQDISQSNPIGYKPVIEDIKTYSLGEKSGAFFYPHNRIDEIYPDLGNVQFAFGGQRLITIAAAGQEYLISGQNNSERDIAVFNISRAKTVDCKSTQDCFYEIDPEVLFTGLVWETKMGPNGNLWYTMNHSTIETFNLGFVKGSDLENVNLQPSEWQVNNLHLSSSMMPYGGKGAEQQLHGSDFPQGFNSIEFDEDKNIHLTSTWYVVDKYDHFDVGERLLLEASFISDYKFRDTTNFVGENGSLPGPNEAIPHENGSPRIPDPDVTDDYDQKAFAIRKTDCSDLISNASSQLDLSLANGCYVLDADKKSRALNFKVANADVASGSYRLEKFELEFNTSNQTFEIGSQVGSAVYSSFSSADEIVSFTDNGGSTVAAYLYQFAACDSQNTNCTISKSANLLLFVGEDSDHDYDGDGFSSGSELTVYMTSPISIDSDNDGLLDSEDACPLGVGNYIYDVDRDSKEVFCGTDTAMQDSFLLIGDNCSSTPNLGQLDLDSDAFGNACDADVNNDGYVDYKDMAIYINAYGKLVPVLVDDIEVMVPFLPESSETSVREILSNQ